MAEDRQIEGQQLEQRLKRLATQWSQGRVSLKQIVGLSEEELYAVANQGYYMFLQGKSEQARVIFEGLVAIDPKNAYYYRALGAIYWRLKEPQKALKQFTYAIRVAPSGPTLIPDSVFSKEPEKELQPVFPRILPSTSNCTQIPASSGTDSAPT